jgi:hypothetical protein
MRPWQPFSISRKNFRLLSYEAICRQFLFLPSSEPISRRLNTLLPSTAIRLRRLTFSLRWKRWRGYAPIYGEYDLLSEHTHPNSFGGILYFADLKTEHASDTAIFPDGGTDPRADLQWIMVAADLLRYFEQALERIEAELPGLSAKGATVANKANRQSS